MAIVCPSCDAEPVADATAGAPCAGCGARLILLDVRDLMIGSVIDDRFEVLGRIGQGGMGVVYRALQTSIQREIALKVLDRHIEQDVSAVKRFFREAKVASTLSHPNTVSIIDFGQSKDGRLYLAMELVRGRTLLDEITQRGALPIARIVEIGAQLCDALEVAHSLKIVHRDLKLENAMLLDGPRDHVKILDFGLARSLTDPNAKATATGLISGTPRYMSPEVFNGADPAPAQDMYAVGVMLAELSLGRALWQAPTLEALFTQKLTNTGIDAVPGALRTLVRMLLAERPDTRPSAVQVRSMLRRLDAAAPTLDLDLDPEESLAHASTGEVPRSSLPALAAAAPAPSDLAFPDSLNIGSLVSLDEVVPPEPARVAAKATDPLPVAARGVDLPAVKFRPPPESVDAKQLELEPKWKQNLSQPLSQKLRPKQHRAPTPLPTTTTNKGGSGMFGILIIMVVLCSAGVGGYMFMRHRADQADQAKASPPDALPAAQPPPPPSDAAVVEPVDAAAPPPPPPKRKRAK